MEKPTGTVTDQPVTPPKAAPEAAPGAAPETGREDRPPLTVLLAAPRGFCAGVDRAILIVERALERYGAPVYVRHEIVHNRAVVSALEAKGAIFVEELDEVPADVPVVFSAHGVPKSVPEAAERRKLFYLDATCPLVSKVHREAEQLHRNGRHILLIGHAGHPEVIGTLGQLPAGAITLVESVADAERLDLPADTPLAFITQTTLSVDDTAAIVEALRRRFPTIAAPRKEDICYATTNRQEAVKAIARRCDAMLVIGAPNSSNSCRLVEVAETQGCAKARLVQGADDIDWDWLAGARTVGVTAGASAPESLVNAVIEACRQRHAVTVEEVSTTEENVIFKLPAALAAE
jgi:4-hydroxy-3-methylbut-2-enyl diphosphate reductase